MAERFADVARRLLSASVLQATSGRIVALAVEVIPDCHRASITEIARGKR